MKRYDEDKIEQFLQGGETNPTKVFTIVKLMAGTNLRIGEILSLEKDCVKLDEDGYHLQYKTYNALGNKTLKMLETNITDEIVELLSNQIEETNKKFPNNKYIFAIGNDKVYSCNQFSNDIKMLTKTNSIRIMDFRISTKNRNIENDDVVHWRCGASDEALRACTEDCLFCKHFILENEKLTLKGCLKKIIDFIKSYR